MVQETTAPALRGAGNKTDEIDSEALKRLFEAFITCRTTLDDLSDRAAALGAELSGPIIAAHLTGKSCVSAQKHNVLVTAINTRLAELSLPAIALKSAGADRASEPNPHVDQRVGRLGQAHATRATVSRSTTSTMLPRMK
jgi:hypothetical protein